MIEPNELARLFDAYADRLVLIARMTGTGKRATGEMESGDRAEDAVQEAFIALATQETMPDDPMAWLVRVTRNQMLQWHRGNGRRRKRERTKAPTRWFASPTDAMEQRIDAQVVTDALQRMPSPDREIIVMHLWGEMTFESIAQIVGGSKATVHRTFQRRLHELKQMFDPGNLAGCSGSRPSKTTPLTEQKDDLG
ncbi:MAG: RNA polymerase sigma factor [Pirellulaceae bacterium]|nr:RNA polymerase sigma factor [Pirellulaceae bacterium]